MAHNRSWTSYTDTDEFITVPANFPNASSIMREAGSILGVIRRFVESNATQPGMDRRWYSEPQYSHCINLPRISVTPKESTLAERNQSAPQSLNTSHLVTTRFRYLSKQLNKKCLVDASKVREQDFEEGISVHRLLKSVCARPWPNYKKFPIGVHHYMGSYQWFLDRNDTRPGRNETFYKEAANPHGPYDVLDQWMDGFVEQVGAEAARGLLKDAGVLLH